MNDSGKKNFIDIYKLEKNNVKKIHKQNKKNGVLLRFWLLVHQLRYQVFFHFQSCFKFQLLLK